MKTLQIYKLIVAYIFLQLLVECTYAQETQLFTNEKRAEYILSFSKNVTWQSASFQTFTIGLVASDSLLYFRLQQQAESIKTLHNKPIRIQLYESLAAVKPCQVLFVMYNSSIRIDAVYAALVHNQTLLLTENFPFSKSMINFTVVNGKRNYEINEQKLAESNLKVNPLLLKYAVKTKEDWEALYAKTEALLVKEQVENVEKTQIIEKQTQHISSQEQTIQNLKLSIEQQKKELLLLSNAVDAKQLELQKTMVEISTRSSELEIQELQLASLNKNIKQQQSILREQATLIHAQEKTLDVQSNKIETQKSIIYLIAIILIVIGTLGYFIFRLYRKTKRINLLLHLKNEEIKKQNEQIAWQNKEITDSIVYARRIQHAILPPQEIISQTISEHFILFKPRDIVSGDYYWMTQIQNKIIITAADCTGHGVPGAFMSLLGITFLHEIVHEKQITQSDMILHELREKIIESLNQSGRTEDYKDGMDMALCVIHKDSMTLDYSGAYNPLYIVRNGELLEIKADKMPVGLSEKAHEQFSITSHALQSGDSLYMFSDGYVDQFGGPQNRKFMSKQFKELICSIQHESMESQKEILDRTIETWRGNTKQIDDIIVIGLKM
ncbi:MAG TPA: YfiR/HmsC family protein [Bacteroidales bacterium]|nr:YfiR/HmsC family protein [Bacteroidales bacterium]